MAAGQNTTIISDSRLEQEASISNSQAMIQKSRDQRLNSRNGSMSRLATAHPQMFNNNFTQEINANILTGRAETNFGRLETPSDGPKVWADGTSSPRISNFASAAIITESSVDQNPLVLQDEMVIQMRHQLEVERKKHRDMKQMFDETINNIETQNRHVSSETIEMQATKAVEEILTKGAVNQAALQDELEK